MNAIAPFKCLLACVTATTMCAMMTACSPSRTPSSDASSTAKRPASTVEVRRGGITPLSSSSTGVQVAPVFSLTTPAKGWFHSTTDQGAYVHAGDVLGTVGDQQVTAPVDGVIETVAQDNDMAADYPLFSIRYGGMSASVDATALLATNAMHRIFQDCMPDRWGRNLMLRAEHQDARSEHRTARTLFEGDLLLSVNDETRQGALRFWNNDGDALAPSETGGPREVTIQSRIHSNDEQLL